MWQLAEDSANLTGWWEAEPQRALADLGHPLSFLPCPLENSSWSLLPAPPQPSGRAPGHIFAICWALTGLFERKNSLNVTKGEGHGGSVCECVSRVWGEPELSGGFYLEFLQGV